MSNEGGQTVQTPAQLAAGRDKRSIYAVYPAGGGLVIVGKRSEATELAHKLNGNWTRIPR